MQTPAHSRRNDIRFHFTDTSLSLVMALFLHFTLLVYCLDRASAVTFRSVILHFPFVAGASRDTHNHNDFASSLPRFLHIIGRYVYLGKHASYS